MDTDQPPRCDDRFSGELDEVAVRAYLEISDDGELARLAAMMAPKAEAFEPVALVNAAIALQEEVKASLVRQREALASGMNYGSLLELHVALGNQPILYVADDDPRLHDPVMGPVLRQLRTVSTFMKRGDAAEQGRVQSALTSADARADRARPILPCCLEEALRYSTADREAHWEVLEAAFVDFLGADRITDPTGTEIAKDGYQEVRQYADHFTPGSPGPEIVSIESWGIYTKYWKNADAVATERSLAWIASKFHAFWTAHGAKYKELNAASEMLTAAMKKNEAKKAKANSEAASKTAPKREADRWRSCTQEFIQFIDGDELSDADHARLIGAFFRQRTGKNAKKDRGTGPVFLEALCSGLDCGFDEVGIVGFLRGKKFNALPEDAMRECFDLLKIAFKSRDEKKRLGGGRSARNAQKRMA